METRVCLIGSVVLCLASAGFTGLAEAGTFVAFGPENYFRDEAAPVDVRRSFTVRNPNTTYALRIDNGGLNHQSTRVSSAIVTINGVQVVATNDLNQNIEVLEKPVTLQSNNQMLVQLRAQPTGTIALQIIGVDNDLPTITATINPLPNAAGWNNTSVTVTFTCSDSTSEVGSCPAPATLQTEGADQEVTGTVVDLAQNTAAVFVSLNIDKTPPNVTIISPQHGSLLVATQPTVIGLIADNLAQSETATCNG